MIIKHWSLPTLSELFYRHQDEFKISDKNQFQKQVNSKRNNVNYHQAQIKAERQWYGAIAAIENYLLTSIVTLPPGHTQAFDLKSGPSVTPREEQVESFQGIMLSGPIPLLSQGPLTPPLYTGVFIPEALNQFTSRTSSLPSANDLAFQTNNHSPICLPLLPEDPIAKETYGLLLTSKFSLVVILGVNNSGLPAFNFSFDPELLKNVWATLKNRLILANYKNLQFLEKLISKFSFVEPDYRLVMQFSRYLLENLPEDSVPISHYPNNQLIDVEKESSATNVNISAKYNSYNHVYKEIELLQALTHEVRTPLTTILTLTRLLLRRSSQLSQDVIKRLETIEQECKGQINRMELIFKATELEKQPINNSLPLLPISLEKLLEDNLPHWQKQSERRNVNLNILLPPKLPIVLGDPGMLEQILTNLLERLTKDLSGGGEIQIQITNAGSQIKIELVSLANYPGNPFKSLGKLLMFQPETGSLSLNTNVTKNLFNLMGGKLTIRQHEHKGEIVTIFLPLQSSYSISKSCSKQKFQI